MIEPRIAEILSRNLSSEELEILAREYPLNYPGLLIRLEMINRQVAAGDLDLGIEQLSDCLTDSHNTGR